MTVLQGKKGFTLIELMLVVIILGVLAAMVMPRLAGRSEEARIAAAKTDVLTNIALGLDLFEMDQRRFPTTEEGLLALRQDPGFTGWKGPYLKRDTKDPWGNPYHYAQPATRSQQDYDLYSAGPNGIEGDEDDVGNW
jgi:general secretion pathway protein G